MATDHTGTQHHFRRCHTHHSVDVNASRTYTISLVQFLQCHLQLSSCSIHTFVNQKLDQLSSLYHFSKPATVKNITWLYCYTNIAHTCTNGGDNTINNHFQITTRYVHTPWNSQCLLCTPLLFLAAIQWCLKIGPIGCTCLHHCR